MPSRDIKPVLSEAMRENFRDMRKWSGPAQTSSEDAIHKMRIAARRMRSTLRIFRPCFKKGSIEQLETELKWLGRLLGLERDAQVLREQLSGALALAPPSEEVERIGSLLGQWCGLNEAEANDGLILALQSQRFADLMLRAGEFAAYPPWSKKATQKAVKTSIRVGLARISIAVTKMEGLEGEERALGLHEVRKSAKRLRYAVEAVENQAGKGMVRLRTLLKEAQDDLGIHHECSESLRLLGQLSLQGENAWSDAGGGDAQIGAPMESSVIAFLSGIFTERARTAEAAFKQKWSDLKDLRI